MKTIGRAPRLPGLSPFGRIPGLTMSVRHEMFFDRGPVMMAVDRATRVALARGALKVQSYAKKSIQKRGKARPPLAIQKRIAALSLYNDARPYPLEKLYKQRDSLTRSQRRAVTQRLLEVALKRQSGSPPGTPPFTHVPSSHMLGFRRNIYWGFDVSRRSVVVGPLPKGNDPYLPALHEHGGTRTLHGYERIGKQGQQAVPGLVVWFSEFARPASRLWGPTGDERRVEFPRRPFMRPALAKAIVRKDLVGAFRNVIRRSGSATVAMRRK